MNELGRCGNEVGESARHVDTMDAFMLPSCMGSL